MKSSDLLKTYVGIRAVVYICTNMYHSLEGQKRIFESQLLLEGSGGGSGGGKVVVEEDEEVEEEVVKSVKRDLSTEVLKCNYES